MHAATFDFAPNPRAVIGGNGGPDDDDGDPDFISKRIIVDAVQFLQFRFPDLDAILNKRKGQRAMAYRFVLCYSLRGLVPSESLARILGINRKTMGENQQRPEAWANHDSEEGRSFDAMLEHVSQAVFHHVSIKVREFDDLLLYWADKDPELRASEKLAKECRRAADEADAAADALQERKRQKGLTTLKRALKGVDGGEAILAKHKGPQAIAKSASPEALAVLERLAKQSAKGAHPRTSELHAQGLKECLKLGLAQTAEPYLSKSQDPMIGPTALGGLVYLEAIAQDRLDKPKRKPRDG